MRNTLGLQEANLSEIAHMIDSVVRDGLGDVMRSAGFRKSGRNFRRTSGESLQVLNVQASSWNACDSGKITVNLGVFYPAVGQILGKPVPQSGVSEIDCHLRRRIFQCMPSDDDLWWSVDATTAQQVAVSLRDAVACYALPWLDRVSLLQAGAAEVGVYEPFRVQLAVALALGRRIEAQQLFRSCYKTRDEVPEDLVDWAERYHLAEA